MCWIKSRYLRPTNKTRFNLCLVQDIALVSITLHNKYRCSALVLSLYLLMIEPFVMALLEEGHDACDIYIFGACKQDGTIDFLTPPGPKSLCASLLAAIKLVFNGTVDGTTFHGIRGGLYAR